MEAMQGGSSIVTRLAEMKESQEEMDEIDINDEEDTDEDSEDEEGEKEAEELYGPPESAAERKARINEART